MKRPCPFCQRSDGADSREHWLPDSWEAYFDVPLVMIDTITHPDADPVVKVNNRSPFDKSVSGICKDCNGGWLKDIDTAAKPIAIGLGLADRTHVAPEEILPLVKHLTRAALMLVWGTRDQHGYEPALFAEFHATREPPSGTRIFIGRGERAFMLPGGRLGLLRTEDEKYGRIASWGMGHLWALVILPIPGLEGVTDIFARQVVRHSARQAQLIWPLPRGWDFDLNGRLITQDLAHLLSRPIALMSGQMGDESQRLPAYFVDRMERLNGDLSPMFRKATKALGDD